MQTRVEGLGLIGDRTTRSVIVGCGSALPDRVMTNADLSRIVDTSDDWIVQRTGIRERRIAVDGERTSDLATRAARAALEDGGFAPDDIDLVVVATTTPDHTFPATAVLIQDRLGIRRGAAFDLQAVCSGFVYGIATVDALLKAGTARRALLIGAETFSRLLDWTDRTTCVLFGDGAGAVVLEARTDCAPGERGVLSARLRSDGAHRDKLYVDGGPSATGTVGHVRMQGREVFKFAVAAVVDVIEDALADAGVGVDDIDWFVPHQANLRIIEASAKKLGIPMERTITTVDRHGNTSAASIPLALRDGVERGLILPGQLVLIEAIGGGFTWGAAVVRW